MSEDLKFDLVNLPVRDEADSLAITKTSSRLGEMLFIRSADGEVRLAFTKAAAERFADRIMEALEGKPAREIPVAEVRHSYEEVSE